MLVEFWYNLIKDELSFAPHMGLDEIHLLATAYKPRNPDCKSCSQREELLLIPTANFLGKDIQMPYCVTHTKEFADYILSLDGIVIVAYEHHHIPLLIYYLGIQPNGGMIGPYPCNRFDIVFEITYSNYIPTLTISTEELGLKGDSTTLPKYYKRYKGRLRSI